VRVALISDVHLEGGPTDSVQPAFTAWLDALDVDQLFLLGDIFHAWWGYDDVVPEGLVPTCAALERVRDRGIALHMVPGNHDFALGSYFLDTLGVQVHAPHIRTFDGVSYFLAHGDEADDSTGYRLARGLLRSRPFAAFMWCLGPSRGWQLVRQLAGSSRHSPADPAALRARQEDFARPFLDTDADYAVMGHIHAPGQSADGRLIHLGGWGDDRTWCLVEDGHPRLVQPE